MPQDVPYRGKVVFFKGKEWIVPSLSVAQFIDNYDALSELHKIDSKESARQQFRKLLPIVGMALRRNYPDDCRDEDLFNWLDLRTFKECLQAVQNLSGLQESAPGEA